MRDGNTPPTLPGISPIVVQELARNVGKLGELFLSEAEFDEIAQAQLSDENIVVLYCYIRDASLRLEDEWRDEFVALFPDKVDLLPAAQT